MGYKLVIAEKPMLGRDIARAMCGRKVSETTPLPISGNGYTVVACAGHLLELVEPEHVDRKWGEPWSIDALPILIPDWPKQPAKGKDDLVERIRGLLDGADCVIHAGDPDDEGQLIVDELLDYLGYKGEVLRVYVNDNIEKNIQKAFERLVPNGECRNAGRAAYARQMADACFGMNETRLATKRLGGRFTVGRVQTPTLGLVVNRDEEIEHHVSRKYYELTAMGGCADAQEPVTFKFKPGKTLLDGETRLFDREPLDALKDRLDGTDTGFTTVLSEKVENPPLPYNLTVLLSDMSRRYGFTAAKTQQITQDLRVQGHHLQPQRFPVPEGGASRAGPHGAGAGHAEPRRLVGAGPHPHRNLLHGDGEGDHAAQTVHGRHPHRRHGVHRQVREGPGDQDHPKTEGRRQEGRARRHRHHRHPCGDHRKAQAARIPRRDRRQGAFHREGPRLLPPAPAGDSRRRRDRPLVADPAGHRRRQGQREQLAGQRGERVPPGCAVRTW